MASGFDMLWKASYLFIFSRFFSIILIFFHSFFEFSTCFTCILFTTIIKIYFINYSWSFNFMLLFFLNCPFKSFAFVKTVSNICCKPKVAFNPIIVHNYYGKPILQNIYYKTFTVIYIFRFSSRIFYKRINKFKEHF